MMKVVNYLSVVMVSVMLLVAGCSKSEDNEADIENGDSTMVQGQMNRNAMNQMASATLSPTQGNEVEGSVTFTKEGDAVSVEGDFTGLTPGKHGFHIHENGDCSAPDGSSAGGHFNPTGMEHGARTDSVRHMGDLGNIEADADGNASVSFTDTVLVLDQIIGKAVIVHGGEDDLTSQPSGAAGPRVACGEIESSDADSTMGNTGRNTEGDEM